MQARNQLSDRKTHEKTNTISYINEKNDTNNNSNKTVFNLNAIINNLKISLEQFDSSIKELKSNLDKDKQEKNQKIQELEESFNSKLNSLKKELIYKESKMNITQENIEKNKPEFNISPKLIKEIVSKINHIDHKSKKFEYDINTKLSYLFTKVKTNNNDNGQYFNDSKSENKYSSRTYGRNSDLALNKNFKKVEELFNKKIGLLDEKIQIVNSKVINLEIKNQNRIYEKNNDENSYVKDSSFNEGLISDRLDKRIQDLKNYMDNKLIKLANKLGIQNLEEINMDISGGKVNEEINGKINNNIQDNNNNKIIYSNLINEFTNKMKKLNDDIDNKIDINIDNKINEIKDELIVLNNKNSENSNINYIDINNQIDSFKSELTGIIEANNNSIEKKIKNLENKLNSYYMDNKSDLEKISSLEAKLKLIDNKIRIFGKKFENITSDSGMNNSFSISNQRNISTENSAQKNSNLNLSISQISRDKPLNINSTILNKEELMEDFFLFSKIRETFPYNMSIKYKLIYKATKHGDTAKDFHSKCDYIGPNLVLVKTKKDFIFGGVTSKSWKHLLKDIKKDDHDFGTQIKDEKAFGFSVNLKKIYKNGKPNECAIFCHNNFGPVFLNVYFKIFDECLKNGGVCGNLEESNFIGLDKDYEFNGEEETFEVEDIEIFQIGFK